MKILNKRRLYLSLQFFAEGGEGSGADGEGTAAGEDNIGEDDKFLAEMEQKYGVVNGVASARAKEFVKSGGIARPTEADADTGVNTESAAEQAEAEPQTVLSAEEEFENLIKSDKFKSLFNAKIQSALKERSKNHKEVHAELEKYKGAVSSLAAKYGKNADDIDGIISAISNDDSLIEDAAYAKGQTVEQYRTEEKNKAERAKSASEIESLKSQLLEYQNREAARADTEKWMTEAKETVKLYPTFDLRTEVKNPDFMKYLQRDKMSVTEAYEHAHLHEIMASQLTAAERKADENAAKIASRNRARVVENANAFKQNTAQSRIDVRNMTDSDFDKIEEMLARGQEVTRDYLM